jgi:glycosyltransferase involved in cell wall biosynthesis
MRLKSNHFTVVILSYNNERWAEKNVNSAINQDYDNYDLVYIDDASTDDTKNIVDKCLESWDSKKGILKYYNNSENLRALPNLYTAVDCAKPGSIIVALDGDDWLANKNVLSELNSVYQDESVWITAGSYLESVGGRIVRPSIPKGYWDKNIRQQHWSFSHLRTFKRELFMSIQKQDFMDEDGDFFKFTWDRVIMYPMIEMSGKEHFIAIGKVMYIYNKENPISVDKVHRSEQLRIESVLVSKQPYDKLRVLQIEEL